MAIFHGFVFAPEKMAAQGQSAGRPSRCWPKRFVASELDFLQPLRKILHVNGVVL
jgi:hypothetical protein